METIVMQYQYTGNKLMLINLEKLFNMYFFICVSNSVKDRSGQVMTGQNKVRQVRKGQNRVGQARTGQNNLIYLIVISLVEISKLYNHCLTLLNFV